MRWRYLSYSVWPKSQLRCRAVSCGSFTGQAVQIRKSPRMSVDNPGTAASQLRFRYEQNFSVGMLRQLLDGRGFQPNVERQAESRASMRCRRFGFPTAHANAGRALI